MGCNVLSGCNEGNQECAVGRGQCVCVCGGGLRGYHFILFCQVDCNFLVSSLSKE